jgi:hypothetical protein
MKVDITYIKRSKSNSFVKWMWYFRTYKFVRGFMLRIFGVHINIRERNATEKLIRIATGAANI